MKKKNVEHIPVDMQLTPETAQEKGFIWTGDHIYRREYDIYQDINDDLWKCVREGCRLGQPASRSLDEDGVGIYAPIPHRK